MRVKPVTKKRGRPPLGRKAMTAAQRQAKRRGILRTKARRAQGRRPYQPHPDYPDAKTQMRTEHTFLSARREFGHEWGVFVDGALLSTQEVIELANLPRAERFQRLAEERQKRKSDACHEVVHYMRALHVTFEELLSFFESERAPYGHSQASQLKYDIYYAEILQPKWMEANQNGGFAYPKPSMHRLSEG
jgi:hypothetical protein